MKLEENLNQITRLAKEKAHENVSFSNFIKIQDTEEIDTIVHELNTIVSKNIDCLSCGNCCKNMRPKATNEALEPFVEPENIEKFKYLREFACKNLDGNKCKIYLDRPRECSEYPYLHRTEFVTRTHEILQNYEICPIVFNVFELLKKELKWVNE